MLSVSSKKLSCSLAGFACIEALCCAVLFHGLAAAHELPATAVSVTGDDSISEKFVRHTVTGITTPLPQGSDVAGFIGASYLTVADIDGDGIQEIIATSGVGPDSDPNSPNGEVALFTWDGINKGAWTQAILNSTFAFPNETQVRDMDADGDLDIVVCDEFLANVVGGVYYLENAGGDITDPLNWEKQIVYQDTTSTGKSYHRVFFLDIDGDGDDDIITVNSSPWIGWLENMGTLPYTPHSIGIGGGSLFTMFDIDDDGDLDIIVPQFGITTSLFTCQVLGGPDGSDPLGDSLAWFENPSAEALASNPNLAWNRYTIDNWYTSSNPIGKGMEAVVADVDNDGISEIVVSNHNHQNKDGAGLRIWPSGVYYFEIPGLGGTSGVPTNTADWEPITIETGDPDFAYSAGFTQLGKPYLDPAVWADTYAVDRRGSYYDQGSPGMVRAGDINGDSLVDLVVPGDGKGRLYYYEAGALSGGDLTFKRTSLYTDLQCMPGEAEIVDLDGDGDLDILAAIFDTSISKPYPYTSSSIFFFEKDSSPSIGGGPYVAAGTWPLLSDASGSPTVLKQNTSILWNFSDDFASCSGECTHTAEYQALGAGTWTSLTVSRDAEGGYAWVDLPVTGLQDATTYAFRFAVTDCAEQTAQSGTYYFRVMRDAPPVITGGPYLAAGAWPQLPTRQEQAFVLNQNYSVLWTFSDDYLSCAGLCQHRARYRKVDDEGWVWTWLPVSTDAAGTQYAYTELPVTSMEAGTYMFRFELWDCAKQTTRSATYYFSVPAPM